MTTPEQLFEEFLENDRVQERYADRNERRNRVRQEHLLPLLEQFLNGEITLEEFKPRNDGLNKEYPLWGFDGFNGQMHFNQMQNAAPDTSKLADRFRDILPSPNNRKEAADSISSFADLAKDYRANSLDSEPRYKPTMFFLSYFWHIQAPTEYPIFYKTTEDYLESQELFVQDGDYGRDYIEFVSVMDNLVTVATQTTDEEWQYRDISNAIYWHEELQPEWEGESESESTLERLGKRTPAAADSRSPFLPPIVADLAGVSKRNEAVEAQYEGVGRNLAVVFERKLHHAFRMLGFDVQALGQGSGREPDGVATAVQNNYAIIYDAKVRENGYSMSTDDRAIRDYIETHARRLRDQGTQQIYFLIISSSFSDPDDGTLRDIRETTKVENIVFLSAELLEKLLIIRLREPYLNLDDLRTVFGTRDGIFHHEELNNVLPEWREVTVNELLQ